MILFFDINFIFVCGFIRIYIRSIGELVNFFFYVFVFNYVNKWKLKLVFICFVDKLKVVIVFLIVSKRY